MKVTGFASQKVFEHFYSEYKKLQKDPTTNDFQVQARQAQDMRKRQYFTTWENKVRRRFQKDNIAFDIKFRIFPLIGSDAKEYLFVPDFTLTDYAYNNKKILIEASEDLNEDDKPMYSAFIQTYGQLYHLIMIVTDNQLRLWNSSSEKLFDDIWTIEDINYFLADLKKHRKNRPQTTEKKTARLVNAAVAGATEAKKTYTCIGCRQLFDTGDPTQLYCSSCLSRF